MRGVLVSFDLEMTGLDIEKDSIIEIGAVRYEAGQVTAEYSTLINPGFAIPQETTQITGIQQEDLRNAPAIKHVLPDFAEFAGNAPIIAHNAYFDMGFMQRYNLLKTNAVIDTYELARIVLPQLPYYNLGSLTAEIGISLEQAHRALDDARATAILYWHLWQKLIQMPLALLDEIRQAATGLDWALLPVFEAAIEERQSAGDNTLTRPDQLFDAPEREITPLQPFTQPTLLDLDAVSAAFDAGGALSRTMTDYEKRDEQVRMAYEVAAAFNNSQHMMIEAGTGTGKALAYLYSAALWATTNQRRVVISSYSQALQNQLLNRDIPLVRTASGQDFSATVMKNRSHYLCPRRLASVRRRTASNTDELSTMAKILIWLHEGGTGNKSEISLRSGEHGAWERLSAQDEHCTLHRCASTMGGNCPYYKARKQAEAAHLVLVDHSLVISDAMNDDPVLPDYQHLIADESHQLEAAITRENSVRINERDIVRRLEDLGDITSGILGDFLKNAHDSLPEKKYQRLKAGIETISEATRAMKAPITAFFNAAREFAQDTDARSNRIRIDENTRKGGSFGRVQTAWRTLSEYFDVISDSLTGLTTVMNRYQKYDIASFDDHLHSTTAAADYLRKIRHFLNAFALEPDANTVYWVNRSSNGEYVTLQNAPLHVGVLMEKHIWQKKESAILTGVTMRTDDQFDYIQERLYAEGAEKRALGSSFDYKKAALVYVPQDMPMPNERDYQKKVERGIVELAAALDGRVMVLFTSYTQLRETSANITPRLALGKITVIDQITGGNRDDLLDNFISTKKAVLLGTRNFWEGVDIPGDDLSALIIARLPFAVPSDPIFAARSETYNDAFQDYAVPDAILRFRQGFGRLIRTAQDRGVVAVLDSRIVNKSYGMRFLESLPDVTVQFGPLADMPRTAQQWLASETT